MGLLWVLVLAVACGSSIESDGPPRPRRCGNGLIEYPEVCEGTSDCSADCLSRCGDGVVGPGEACDSANNPSCTDDCHSSCGDGIIGPGEACDPLNDPYCSDDCHTIYGACGDGIIRSENEQCDDGNTTPGDGCWGCLVVPGYTCSGEPSVCTFGPAVDPATLLNDATAADIKAYCEWAVGALGGANAMVMCSSSATGYAILKDTNDCIAHWEGIPYCTATLVELAACLRPLLQRGDVCFLQEELKTCAADTCAGLAVTQCTGNGCPGSACKANADCIAGTHCTGEGRGWCDCDASGVSVCGAPSCAVTADCAEYGASIDCVGGACEIELIPPGSTCDQGSWCTSGTCTGGKCTGNHDVREGGHCESSDWCLPGISRAARCCASVCKEVTFPTDCTGQTGSACSFDYDCASYQCVGQMCT